MSINISVICRKDRISQNNTAPVFLQFTQDRKSRYVSTGVNIDIEAWDFDKQRVKEGVTNDSRAQYQIDTKRYEYDKKMRKLEALDIDVTLDNLLETNNRKVNCTLSDWITRLESMKSKRLSAIKATTFGLFTA